TPQLQRPLREAIEAAFEQPLPDVSVVASLGVASKVDPTGVRPLLQKFSGEGVSPAVRAAAVRGMAGQKLTAAQIKSFLVQLEDPAQRDVHESIRELLSTLAEGPGGVGPGLRRALLAARPGARPV